MKLTVTHRKPVKEVGASGECLGQKSRELDPELSSVPDPLPESL